MVSKLQSQASCGERNSFVRRELLRVQYEPQPVFSMILCRVPALPFHAAARAISEPFDKNLRAVSSSLASLTQPAGVLISDQASEFFEVCIDLVKGRDELFLTFASPCCELTF